MNYQQHHITELFKQYAGLQQNLLSRPDTEQHHAANRFFEQLLDRFHRETDVSILLRALPDPYFPLGMLEQTIFVDVVGMRFIINKKRWDLEPILGQELVEWAEAFLRIRYTLKLNLSDNFPDIWIIVLTIFRKYGDGFADGDTLKRFEAPRYQRLRF
jgi:hypothetical protein